MTIMLFRNDAYLDQTPARVEAVTQDGSIMLDQTVFYATSGGQPGDVGMLTLDDGRQIAIENTVHPGGDKLRIAHVPAAGQDLPVVGAAVLAAIDWPRRHRLMRMHTALHLLSVAMPYPVTGGSIGADKGRLDFAMPEAPGDLAQVEAELNAYVAADLPVSSEWISDEEMAAKAELIKTMKVKPPMGQGRVRLVRIGEIDLQPCGGTHVRSTGEIGPLKLGKLENKGAQNKRLSLLFA